MPKPHSHGWAHLKSNWKEPIEPLGTTCSVISFAKDAHAASGQCANKLVPEQQHTLTPDSFTDSLTTLLFAPWQLLPGCWTYELEHVHLVQREREDLLITFHELEPVPSPLFWATVPSDYKNHGRGILKVNPAHEQIPACIHHWCQLARADSWCHHPLKSPESKPSGPSSSAPVWHWPRCHVCLACPIVIYKMSIDASMLDV